jgi:hypothetical protein
MWASISTDGTITLAGTPIPFDGVASRTVSAATDAAGAVVVTMVVLDVRVSGPAG